MGYEMTWVDFVRKDTLLTGGMVNGFHGEVMHRFNDRASAGGEYGVRLADLNGGSRKLSFQESGGVLRYRVGPETSFEASAGVAYLDDRTLQITRAGPHPKPRLRYRADRA